LSSFGGFWRVIICVLMVAIIGVRSDAISSLGLISMELCDSHLKIKKSSRSGVLLISVGQ
jgi:hypothetical protein